MTISYSLNNQDYSISNALLWGNCRKHFEKACDNEGRLADRIVHALIGFVELIPIVSQISSIFEMIIVNSFSRNASFPVNLIDNQSIIERKGNATADEFIACVNPQINRKAPLLTQEEVQRFIRRGGTLNIVDGQKQKITLHPNEPIITGCTSGINRSQVSAGILKQHGLPVIGVLAGGDSPMNPDCEFAVFHRASIDGNQNFTTVFGSQKQDQIAQKEYFGKPIFDDELDSAKQFYQNYINSLSPTHFITFALSGSSVIRRLLQREGSLQNFTITFIPWGDEIAHPPEGIKSESPESYHLFIEKFLNCFDLID